MFLKLAECLRKLLLVIYNYKFNSLHHFKHCLWCYLLFVWSARQMVQISFTWYK